MEVVNGFDIIDCTIKNETVDKFRYDKTENTQRVTKASKRHSICQTNVQGTWAFA